MGKKYSPVKLEAEPFKLAQALSAEVKWSGKQFVEECILAIAELANAAPENRTVPYVVRLIDAARKNQQQPVKLPASKVEDGLRAQDAADQEKIRKKSGPNESKK